MAVLIGRAADIISIVDDGVASLRVASIVVLSCEWSSSSCFFPSWLLLLLVPDFTASEKKASLITKCIKYVFEH